MARLRLPLRIVPLGDAAVFAEFSQTLERSLIGLGSKFRVALKPFGMQFPLGACRRRRAGMIGHIILFR